MPPGMTEVGRPTMSEPSMPSEGDAPMEMAEADHPAASRSSEPRGDPEPPRVEMAWPGSDDPALPRSFESREGLKRPCTDEAPPWSDDLIPKRARKVSRGESRKYSVRFRALLLLSLIIVPPAGSGDM